VQYAAVRARKIFQKYEELGEPVPDFPSELGPEALSRQLQTEDFWQMLLTASKTDAALEGAAAAGEPAQVAKYAFQLAQAFANFYQKYPIIHEQNREKKVFLLWMTGFFRGQLERALNILGIETPPYM
jgi:arginyl-tRNA synthetase